jgi:hypothetical protein
MPDSSDIDAALVAKLGADATLLGYMPNNVHIDEATAGSTRFVIVSLIEETDSHRLGGRAHEDALYLVKAVAVKTSGGVPPVKEAAARIDALLDGGTLTVNGYTLMTMHRESRIRYTEVDEEDESIRWYHRGGQYRVMMSL